LFCKTSHFTVRAAAIRSIIFNNFCPLVDQQQLNRRTLLLPMADIEHSYAGEMASLSPGHRHQSTRGIYDELTGDDK
jgi:hypothetical protein